MNFVINKNQLDVRQLVSATKKNKTCRHFYHIGKQSTNLEELVAKDLKP